MKLLYNAAFSLLALLSLCACGGGGKSASIDSLSNDSVLVLDSGDYTDITFKSPDEVTDFLDFKRFASPDGYIAFHGKGGVMDGEGFKVTDVKLTGDKTAELFVHIPKGDLEGRLLLTVEDSDVTILDKEANVTYRIQPLSVKK